MYESINPYILTIEAWFKYIWKLSPRELLGFVVIYLSVVYLLFATIDVDTNRKSSRGGDYCLQSQI